MNPTRFAVFLLVTVQLVFAQNTPPPTSEPSNSSALVLDPFNVTESETKGYQATNTISGTAMNQPLKEVPMAINVITSEFLADSLVGDFTQALDFNSAITQTTRTPTENRGALFSIRGFSNRNVLVDGVSSGNYIPTQMIDRIEIVKGPNTLYGQSDPGGLINVISKRPQGRDRLIVGLRAGDHGVRGGEFDANAAAGEGRLGLRIIGASNRSDGYRIVDGSKTTFVGVAGDIKVAPDTTILFNVSDTEIDGISSQRSAFSFEIVPTDLNGDGVISNTVINGVNETNTRFNGTFLPRDYTSATDDTRYTQESKFIQLGLRQRIGRNVNLQYMFVRTDQDIDMTFREYNTFNAAGVADAIHGDQTGSNRTDAHSLNALFSVKTGPLTHRFLLGGRYTWDESSSTTHFLRTLGPAAERDALADLIASGRRIRLLLTKDDVLSGVPYWRDEVPTSSELRTLGTRSGNIGRTESRVSTLYLTDSVSVLSNRLKILGGLRYVRIRGQSTNVAGEKIGVMNDQDDISHQIGATYDLTSDIAAYANTATAFNPNGFDADNGVFFDPERSRAYEVGLKFEDLWRGKLGGSVSLFQIRKANVRRSDFNPVTFRSDTEFTDDQSRGWETELFFNPTAGWQMVFNYSRIDAKTIASRTTAKDLRLEGAAPHRVTFWSSYALAGGSLKGLRFGGGMIYAAGPIQQFGTSNNQFVLEDGYTTFNLFVRYPTRILNQAIEFGLNVDNLTDQFYMRTRAAASNPRQIVFSMRWEN